MTYITQQKAIIQTPVIISASRSTDIPAFYAQWFMNRLRAGHVVWYNPFNRKPTTISFEKTKVIVFWSKNPIPLIPYFQELDQRGIHYYIQFTLNDYEREGFEPNVPPLAERIKTFQYIAEALGKERVIWRFDPLMLTPELTPRQLLARIWHIGNSLKGYTNKLVFSFVDILAYRKVQQNLIKRTNCFAKENITSAEITSKQRQELIDGLVKLRDNWQANGWDIELATCAEQIDLEAYGIKHNHCIDGKLIEQIWHDDYELIYYLRTGTLHQADLFNPTPPLPASTKNLKDKGQRRACGCILSKDIGMYNTCPHLCVYCYANASPDIVQKNFARHDPSGESIIPSP